MFASAAPASGTGGSRVPAVSPAALETVYIQSVRDPTGSEVTGFKNITPPPLNFFLRSKMVCLSFKQFSSDFSPQHVLLHFALTLSCAVLNNKGPYG